MAALYLKYRPQTFNQLIGQKGIKDILLPAFSAGKLSHAYLFSGPRGTGKTSTARILAKMVKCSAEQNIPCNKCDSCLSITDGSNLDLIEIDAASNRGIDDIRLLRENIKLSPSSGNKKIYIIDEVHMLTAEAFNALLKTLEEPPSHAIFILATTDPQKIPQTILSRVTRLEFKLASQNEIVEALNVVVSGEKIKIEEEALKLLAKKSEGSFRDGVKLLDQMASGEKITTKEVENLLRSGNFEVAFKFLEVLAKKDIKKSLLELIKQEEAGIQLRDFTLFLMDILRSVVLIKNNLGAELVKNDAGTEKYEKLQELANKFSMGDVIRTINKLQEALEKMKTTLVVSLPLELAVLEICGEESSVISHQSSDIVIARSEATKQSVKEKITSLPEFTPSEVVGVARNDENQKISPQIPTSHFPLPTSNSDLSKIHDRWTFVLETVRQNNFSLEALLRNAKIIDYKRGIVSIEVPYAFHQRILEQQKSRDLLEAVISDVLSEPVKIVTVLGSRPQRIEDIANVELAKEDEIITLAADIFNGKLVD